jgi:lipoprotein-anchoring transpeptidase ErfK/SrfK
MENAVLERRRTGRVVMGITGILHVLGSGESVRRAASGVVLLAMIGAAPLELPGAEDARGTPPSRKEMLAWQIALERKGFSPGLVDGIVGPKTVLATRAFQTSCDLPVTGEIDPLTAKTLEVDTLTAVESYPIKAEDLALVGYCPPDWLERSRRSRLLYPTIANCLAEKFHTSERCLAWLNPKVDLALLEAGETLQVPGIRAREPLYTPARIEIDLERKLVLLLDEVGNAIGLLHCSVAKDLSRVRRGDTVVSTLVENPHYTFDPKMWPEVKNVKRKLVIPDGPRSPVGIRWIGLDLPGVGIHGTPEPEHIGKTGSHGCFRLTNWDAIHLASQVSIGTPVGIVDASSIAARIAGDAAPPPPNPASGVSTPPNSGTPPSVVRRVADAPSRP